MGTERTMRVFFSVGEPSGDVHGANLIRQLQARCDRLEAVGYGGPRMAAAGCRLFADLTALAVMWFTRAVLHLPKFWNLLWQADRFFRDERPDAVVLIDYPGFNWWIARRARKRGIPVFYYVPPQIWAWAQWRVGKMRRLVDHVLCALPFEAEWLRRHGCNATWAGHPFFDEVGRQPLDEAFLERLGQKPGPLVTILPGSRTQEVTHNLPWFLKAAGLIQAAVPDVRFAIASFNSAQAEMARRQVAAAGLDIEVHVGKTPELIRLADCAMAVSGSVSLELLAETTPTVVLYFVGRMAYWVQGWFRKVKYITLVNLLAAEELFPADLTPYDPGQPDAHRVLFPEYLTCEDRSPQMAMHVVKWLSDVKQREALVARLGRLKAQIGQPGASARAAEYVLRALSAGPASIPQPHFAPGTGGAAPSLAESGSQPAAAGGPARGPKEAGS